MADMNAEPNTAPTPSCQQATNPQTALTRIPLVLDMIANRRLGPRPANRNISVHISPINFESLNRVLVHLITPFYQNWDLLLNHYFGSNSEITSDIRDDVQAMVDLALHSLYNRLRAVAEDQHIATKATRMNRRAPVKAHNQYPTILARIINTIGLIEPHDAPMSTKSIYTCTENTGAYFGRTSAIAINNQRYHRLIMALTRINATLDTVDFTSTQSSYWPTARCCFNEYRGFTVYSTFHQSHYTIEDSVLGLLLHPSTAYADVFEDFTFYAEKIESDKIIDALAGDCAATDPPRFNHGMFEVDSFGIAPASTANGARCCWIIGQGDRAYYTASIFRDVDESEKHGIFQSAFRALTP